MTSVAARAEAGHLYHGPVMHQRMLPFGHRFSANVFSLLIDLDQLDDLFRGVPFAAVDRPALVSFHRKDHGPRDGLARPARLFLLCYPRVLGHTFNPLSVYYAFDAGGAPVGLLYEVRNTFGDMHTYVAPLAPGDAGPAGIRQGAKKRFFVSPFLGFDLAYRFRLTTPGDTLAVRILEVDDAARPVFAATFHGERRPLNAMTLARACLAVPFLGLNVVARIHWQAIRLWLKGADFHHRPPAPDRPSFLQAAPASAPPRETTP
jgi:uncharacterized protein